SFDPNDKLAFPKGVQEQHYIRENTDLEYEIRFQNIGTAEALKVVVQDGISPFLDLSTLQLGASSHPYRFEILPNDQLQFTFEDINLVPQSVSETASQGFVKFRISQQVNNPIGTVINNSALIFFDNNEPIVTNTTFHEIGADFIDIVLSTRKELDLSNKIQIAPNPFSQSTFITLTEIESSGNYSIKVYDSIGQVIRRDHFWGTSYEFKRKNLGPGLYLFNIEEDQQIIATGKMVIH
ncbi:MAG: T9SS type A sorting domain-containing protein, partial [Bacteroidota bacterium]